MRYRERLALSRSSYIFRKFSCPLDDPDQLETLFMLSRLLTPFSNCRSKSLSNQNSNESSTNSPNNFPVPIVKFATVLFAFRRQVDNITSWLTGRIASWHYVSFICFGKWRRWVVVSTKMLLSRVVNLYLYNPLGLTFFDREP